MRQYLDLLEDLKTHGIGKDDRTGTGTRSLFGRQLRFDLAEGFPLLTTKRVFIKGVIHELLWLLSGNTNIAYLKENSVGIWDAWANAQGELGPVYGKQWRSWSAPDGREIDQIAHAIDLIKTDPSSRRIIVTAWNPADLPQEGVSPQDNATQGRAALASCHAFFQFYVADGKLSCHLYQRSADVFLGVPFNIASYALLTMMIAHVCELEVGDFVHSFGDVHIYNNHIDQVNAQLLRMPKKLPTMKINPAVKHIDLFTYDDFTLEGYDPDPAIKAPISV